MEEISLYGPGGKPAWFWKLNPRGEVPVLVCQVGDVVLPDSDLILDEIGNVLENGSKLIPDDEPTKSRIAAFRKALKEFLPVGKKAVLGGRKDEMWAKLKELDHHIQGPYVCGDAVTIADCAGFPFLWRIDKEFGPLDQNGCKNIHKWLHFCASSKAFANTVQPSWWWWW